jgi:hypothetical protein
MDSCIHPVPGARWRIVSKGDGGSLQCRTNLRQASEGGQRRDAVAIRATW